MINTLKYVLIIINLFIILNCTNLKKQRNSSLNTKLKYSNIPQKMILINSIPAERPEWTINEPERNDEFLVFIGISDNSATEKQARKSALYDVIKQFAEYCGVEVKDLYQSISSSYGLSSDIKDETIASKGSTLIRTDAFVSRVKAKKWYLEIWGLSVDNKILEKYYKMYVYATVPKDEYYQNNAIENK